MGLDMYLTAEIEVLPGTEIAQIIEEKATEEHREQMSSEDWGYSAYVSGWLYGNREPESLYTALKRALNYEPHAGSPRFEVRREEGGSYVVSPMVMYWRKANQIHRWFVEEVQNGEDECRPHYVHPEQIADLVERCEQIMEDHELAPKLLPTRSGFFFGSTEYDEWYFSDIEATAKGLKSQIFRLPRGARLVYCSSW